MNFRKLVDQYAVGAAVYGVVEGISAITEWATQECGEGRVADLRGEYQSACDA
jgi:hypothetical protein